MILLLCFISYHPPARKREVLFILITGLFSPPGRIDGRVAYYAAHYASATATRQFR
jgi:hypothetical protein